MTHYRFTMTIDGDAASPSDAYSRVAGALAVVSDAVVAASDEIHMKTLAILRNESKQKIGEWVLEIDR